MCELLGLSANRPSDINHALKLFAPRGGAIGPHADGWGLAYYDGKAARIFREPSPAAESLWLEFISTHRMESQLVIGHIRKANPSRFARSIGNTHPFQRELFGRTVVFAHNGKMPGVFDLPLERYHPIGETDSEHAFCYLLDRLARWPDVFAAENLLLLAGLLESTATELSRLGEFNFLLSEGEHLFAYGDTNLHAVERQCLESGCRKRVALVATEPVTGHESWRKLPGDRITIFRDGREVRVASAPARHAS